MIFYTERLTLNEYKFQFLKNKIQTEKRRGYVCVIEKLDIEICQGFVMWFLEFFPEHPSYVIHFSQNNHKIHH